MFDLDVLYYLCGFLCLVQIPIILYWRWYYYIEEETFRENLGFYVMCAFDPVLPFLCVLILTGWCRYVGYSLGALCDGIVDGAMILNFVVWSFVIHKWKDRYKILAYLFVITLATVSAA